MADEDDARRFEALEQGDGPVGEGLDGGERGPFALAVAWQVGRFAALGAFLLLCAKGGAAPLLGAGAGIAVGRQIAMRGA